MKNIFLSLTLLFSVLFTVAQVENPSPRVVFGDLKYNGPYDRSEILLQEQLNVSSDDGKTYQIVSYNLTISPTAGKPIRFEEKGDKLSAKLQGALNQIVGGDKILIESVFAVVNEDKYDIRMLSPIELMVKEYKSSDEIFYANTPVKMDSTLQATFGTIEADGFPKSLEELLGQTEIGVKSEGNVDYTVKRFKLIAVPIELPPSMASSSNNQLTGQMQKMISKLQSGDRILVEGIRAEADVDGKTIPANLSPIVITVR